ncbi:MAG: AgmX/PglI C-terminal domain-containing protein [Polyangiaceae bacterium]
MSEPSGPSLKGMVVTGVAVALVIAAVVYWLPESSSHRAGSNSSATTSASNTIQPFFPESNGSTSAAPAQKTAPNADAPQLDRARADAMRKQLRNLPPLSPIAKNANGTFPVMPAATDTNAELAHYIKDKIHADYMPLAKTCYESALVKAPNLGGRLVMKFRIVGDRRVGGVVDSAEVDPETTIQGDEFLTCVKESMMAVSFDAPPNDGHVDVTYPILFSPDDGGGEDGG